MSRRIHKDFKPLVRAALSAGMTLDDTGRHLRLKAVDGRSVTLSGTPSDRRSFLNVRADLRRMGVKL